MKAIVSHWESKKKIIGTSVYIVDMKWWKILEQGAHIPSLDNSSLLEDENTLREDLDVKADLKVVNTTAWKIIQRV